MPIQILPAILANQIAAGEVVERPASVIKELVENSLDAGATQIEVEIDKGGHKRILVRDNGKGIAKEELTLALSRHATSKIAYLDDLEQIMSLGFRGEALASISAVARLTLTSRTVSQTEAWQAHAEGRDMEVCINPAAHPKGTSVEVLDLFFNTPARRKFLRTEKTEFSHIEEVIKRIALSRFDVSFSLKHNGKLIRRYPLANNENSQFKRVSTVCGNEFSQHALQVTSHYQQLKLSGWLAGPGGARNQNDIQYFYVNGRMMRDKLINHAIRQAFEGLLPSECYPAFALYLEIPADEVDVNVHPAKHEVRFHQSRLVHDFIYRAITDVLEQPYLGDENAVEDGSTAGNVRVLEDVVPKHEYITPLKQGFADSSMNARHGNASLTDYNTTRSTSSGSSYGSPSHGRFTSRGASGSAGKINSDAAVNYQALMQPAEQSASVDVADWLSVEEKWLLIKIDQGFYRLALTNLYRQKLLREFENAIPVAQPLLMPVSLDADETLLDAAKKCYEPLLNVSVEIGWAGKRVLLRKVPAGYRQLPWTNILESLLTTPMDENCAVQTLAATIASHTDTFDDNAVKRLMAWLTATWPNEWQDKVISWSSPVPLANWMKDNGSH